MKKLKSLITLLLIASPAFANDLIPLGSEVTWDKQSIIANGKRIVPVMGEVHYSRIPAEEWDTEIKKIKAGGVDIIATYCFWNHHEEIENQFDWSGNRNLRRFIELCRDNNMPVILRLGPFCHGEVRNGGIPDWMLAKPCKMRSEQPEFLENVAKLYRQIFAQIQGLQWKDGGPLLGAQFDNEYRGHGSYLMKLKQIAQEIGFDLPIYTRTGWPDLASPVPYGEMLPLYGDYADGFWERKIDPEAGSYYKAFNFKAHRKSTAIASEQLGQQNEKDTKDASEYPYLTCELGSGMATAYHRRPYIYPEDTYSMAIVKLGSGSNMPGYYMYHGGTNPYGKLTTLNENQSTQATNYNDMPVMTYDFQAPIDESGILNPHYYKQRKLHRFLHDFGEQLAPMQPVLMSKEDIDIDNDSELRWSYRTADGNSAFVFVNNYQRLRKLSDKRKIRFTVGNVSFPSKPITIPSGAICIFPVNIAGITYATAQPLAMTDDKVYLEQIPDIPTEIAVDGKVLKNVKPLGCETPVYGNIYLLTSDQADRFCGPIAALKPCEDISYTKTKDAVGQRKIEMGAQKVAVEPSDTDFDNAAVYEITLPANREGKILEIDYQGDCARLYAGDLLICDNFYNGRKFRYPLWRIPDSNETLTLKILPIQPDMPIYFSEEADTTIGENVRHITTVTLCED